MIKGPIDLGPVIATSRVRIAELRDQRARIQATYDEAYTYFGFAPFVTLLLASLNSCDEQIRNWERMLREMGET